MVGDLKGGHYTSVFPRIARPRIGVGGRPPCVPQGKQNAILTLHSR